MATKWMMMKKTVTVTAAKEGTLILRKDAAAPQWRENNNSFIWHQMFTLHPLLKSTYCAVSPLNHRSSRLWYWIISGIKSTHGRARPKKSDMNNSQPSAVDQRTEWDSEKWGGAILVFILKSSSSQLPPPCTSTLHCCGDWQRDNCNSPHTDLLIWKPGS